MFIVEDNGVLDWSNIINWEDPLNTGLVSEWVVGDDNPYWGGPKLWDVAGQNHGTLTNGPTWQGPLGRPGGFGSLSLASASSQYVNSSFVITAYPLTLVAWFRSTSTTDEQWLISVVDGTSTGNWFSVGARGDLGAVIQAFERVGGANFTAQTSATYSANTWHMASAVFVSATSRRVYLDGRNVVSDTSNSGGPPSGLTRTTIGQIGHSSGGGYLNGQIGMAAVFSAALSDSEIFRLYQESRLGNPTRWNWIRRPQYVEQAGGGGGTPSGVGNLLLLGCGA